MFLRKWLHLTVLIIAVINDCVTGDANLLEYDYCGNELNALLSTMDAGHIYLTTNGLDNPDNSVGWSHGYLRTLPSLPTEVDIHFGVILLGGIDDEKQTMTMTAMLHMHWKDSRIALDDPQCENSSAQFIVNPAKNLPWYPQWVVSNGRGANVLKSESWEFSPVVVDVKGEVDWKMSFEWIVDCPLVVTYFPFDVQLCSVDIASPQYDMRMVNFSVGTDAVSLKEAESQFSPLWTLAGYRHTDVSTSYPSVSFKFMLVRRPTYFVSALIVPTVAINVMTAFVFLTAANQEEKASSGVACLVAYFFIDVLFFDLSPMSSDTVPVLCIFLTFHSYFALFVLCVAARLVFYAEYVEEAEAVDILLQHGIELEKTKRKKEDGVRHFRSPEFYNDLCLIAYAVVAVLSYLAVFSFLPIKSNSIRNNLLLSTYSAPHVVEE